MRVCKLGFSGPAVGVRSNDDELDAMPIMSTRCDISVSGTKNDVVGKKLWWQGM